MEDKNNRSSIFTVKDAENTILWFCFYIVILTIGIIFHQCLLRNYKVIDSFYFVGEHISKVVASSTMMIVFGEGVDIMLRRFREAIQREREIRAQARAEGLELGREEGREEGRNLVYREIEEWKKRKTEAEARGEEFTEPLPQRKR